MKAKAPMELTSGVLVLADISGYTKFVTQTEIDHSWAILHELLDCMVYSVKGNLEVSQVEGDCILFIGALSEAQVVDLLEASYVAFRRRLRAMQELTTCPCAACRHIDTLALKYIVHRGTYSRQKVGTIEQLHGSDVILGFRLLKNSLPLHEYLLVSDAVRVRLSEARRAEFTAHSEEYDHIGPVDCGYRDLRPLWDHFVTTERRRVDRSEADMYRELTVDLPADRAWPIFDNPDYWRRMLGVATVSQVPGARGQGLDGELHCHHGGGRTSLYRIVSSDRPHEVSYQFEGGLVGMFQTISLAETPEGGTRVGFAFRWRRDPGRRAAVERFIWQRAMSFFSSRFEAELRKIAGEVAAASPAAPATLAG